MRCREANPPKTTMHWDQAGALTQATQPPGSAEGSDTATRKRVRQGPEGPRPAHGQPLGPPRRSKPPAEALPGALTGQARQALHVHRWELSLQHCQGAQPRVPGHGQARARAGRGGSAPTSACHGRGPVPRHCPLAGSSRVTAVHSTTGQSSRARVPYLPGMLGAPQPAAERWRGLVPSLGCGRRCQGSLHLPGATPRLVRARAKAATQGLRQSLESPQTLAHHSPCPVQQMPTHTPAYHICPHCKDACSCPYPHPAHAPTHFMPAHAPTHHVPMPQHTACPPTPRTPDVEAGVVAGVDRHHQAPEAQTHRQTRRHR